MRVQLIKSLIINNAKNVPIQKYVRDFVGFVMLSIRDGQVP